MQHISPDGRLGLMCKSIRNKTKCFWLGGWIFAFLLICTSAFFEVRIIRKQNPPAMASQLCVGFSYDLSGVKKAHRVGRCAF
ncbi:hypothetical protein EII18_00825 [Comamonadaceae bacterium OH3737_COT-264]|nr:hypothetical protein EII18_00825 [Comamonadaceae bacterium OH3737_COT-264]